MSFLLVVYTPSCGFRLAAPDWFASMLTNVNGCCMACFGRLANRDRELLTCQKTIEVLSEPEPVVAGIA